MYMDKIALVLLQLVLTTSTASGEYSRTSSTAFTNLRHIELKNVQISRFRGIKLGTPVFRRIRYWGKVSVDTIQDKVGYIRRYAEKIIIAARWRALLFLSPTKIRSDSDLCNSMSAFRDWLADGRCP